MPATKPQPPHAGARVLSGLLAAACLAVAYFTGSSASFHVAAVVLVIPLGMIWYGGEIGSFAGSGEEGSGEAVGWLIAIAGWLALLAIFGVLIVQAAA